MSAAEASMPEVTVRLAVMKKFNEAVKDLPGLVQSGMARDEDDKLVLFAQFDTIERSLDANVPDKFGGYDVHTTYVPKIVRVMRNGKPS